MNRSRAISIRVLIILALPGMLILSQAVPDRPAYAAGSSAFPQGEEIIDAGAAANSPRPEEPAVPISSAHPAVQLFVGLLCALFILIGLFPLFLLDRDASF